MEEDWRGAGRRAAVLISRIGAPGVGGRRCFGRGLRGGGGGGAARVGGMMIVVSTTMIAVGVFVVVVVTGGADMLFVYVFVWC